MKRRTPQTLPGTNERQYVYTYLIFPGTQANYPREGIYDVIPENSFRKTKTLDNGRKMKNHRKQNAALRFRTLLSKLGVRLYRVYLPWVRLGYLE